MDGWNLEEITLDWLKYISWAGSAVYEDKQRLVIKELHELSKALVGGGMREFDFEQFVAHFFDSSQGTSLLMTQDSTSRSLLHKAVIEGGRSSCEFSLSTQNSTN